MLSGEKMTGINIVNPLILAIGVAQIIAGVWGLWIGTPKAGVISISVGIANIVMSTVKA